MNDLYALGEEQRAMLRTVRRFVAEVVAPVAAELDRAPDPEDCFSWDIVERADEAGIRTMTLAKEHGGSGADSLTTAMVIEELAKGAANRKTRRCSRRQITQSSGCWTPNPSRAYARRRWAFGAGT